MDLVYREKKPDAQNAQDDYEETKSVGRRMQDANKYIYGISVGLIVKERNR